MRHRPDAHLQQKPLISEDLVLAQDLVGDLLRAAHQQRALGPAHRVELPAPDRQPAAFPPDGVHGRGVVREERVGRALRRVADEAQRVDAQRHGQRIVPGARGRGPIELRKRREAIGHAADDGQRHRQAECAGTNGRGRRAADGHPDRKSILQRSWIHAALLDRGPMHTRPRDALGVAQAHQQIQLLRKQRVVVAQVLPEQRIRLDERAAPRHDLGPSAGQQVHGGELLKHAHGIVRAEHGDRARQADPFGPHGSRRQDHRRRRHGVVRPVVFSDTEDIEPDLVGQLDLLNQMAHAHIGRQRDARLRVARDIGKGIQTEFNHGSDLRPYTPHNPTPPRPYAVAVAAAGRRMARFATPPTTPMASAIQLTSGVHSVVRPSSASSE